MGRPINKRYLGDPAGGTQIRVEANTGNGAVDTAYIVSQKGTNKFKVTDGTTVLNCTIVNKDFTDINVGEMVISGQVSGGAARLPIMKMFNNTAIDFEGNRYSWEVQDDSTETVLVLTSI